MDIFSLDPSPTFVAPVTLPVPGGAEVVVKFRFRHKDEAEFYDMLAESRAQKENFGKFLARFVDGWEGDNINAPFSLEALAKLCRNYPRAAQAIFRVYEAELIGAVRKN